MRILICLLFLLAGFENGVVKRMDYQPQFDYVIVEIEGKMWVATPTHGGYWTLAGPLE